MKKLSLILGIVAAGAVLIKFCDCPGCPDGQSVLCPANLAMAMLGILVVGSASLKAFGRKSTALLVLLALLTGFASSTHAGDPKEGGYTAIPLNVTLAELTANPASYVGKEVTVTAKLVGICAEDGCLTLKDKTDVIEGVPPEGGFKKNPKPGSTLSVTGTVKMKKGEVHIDVKSFEEVKK